MDRTSPERSLVVSRQPRRTADAEDDWAGVEDPAERRKRQNRLHQRAWRRKKAAEKAPAPVGHVFVHQEFRQARQPTGKVDLVGWQSVSRDTEGPDTQAYGPVPPPSMPPSSAPVSRAESHDQGQSSSAQHQASVMGPVVPRLTRETGSSVAAPFVFPLAPDHRLITLIQLNVMRAILTNLTITRLLHRLPPECSSSRLLPIMTPLPEPSSASMLPPSLQPTALQQALPHDYWISTVPSAAMRDNLIRSLGAFDEDDLCGDIVGGLYDGFDEVEKRGLIVWGEPWRAEGWEVTEGFAKKWGFLLRGCEDMVEATNRWRAVRGEERLVIEI